MPITDTLRNAEGLRQAGFTENQAKDLANRLEDTARAQSDDLKSFIRQEMAGLEARIRTEIASVRTQVESVRAELHSSLRDQMLKFITILVAVVSLAVAAIKLFPDWH